MAPVMVPDKSVSMCQVCGDEFTVIFRRHHCRACGKVHAHVHGYNAHNSIMYMYAFIHSGSVW